MKRVHDIDMVAHLWANKSQPEARNAGGNFYFDGNTVYSYGSHFPIAKHVTDKKGRPAVLFTTRTYSVTTSKHLWTVRHATRHLNVVKVHNPHNSLEENLKVENGNVKTALKEAATSRKGRSLEKKLEALKAALDQRNALAAFMGRKPTALPEDLNAALAAIAKVEKREAAAAVKARNARNLFALVEREKAAGAPFGEWLTKWQEGMPGDIRHVRYSWGLLAATAGKRDGVAYPKEMPCVLRLINAGTENETVQTSWGADVPAAHAHRIYKVWARVQGKVPPEGWTPASQTEGAVGAFKVDRIEPDGTIYAGCHTIYASAVQDFAARVGWAA